MCFLLKKGVEYTFVGKSRSNTLKQNLAYIILHQLSVELPSKPELLEIFGRVLINSFNIMDDEYQPIGIGLYLAASVFDHSCNPNAAIVFKGKGKTCG
jgi:hypothetical protein